VVLKILYAGEDEGMDIDADGNLVITAANGQVIKQEVKKLVEAAGTTAGADADMNPEGVQE
jgi:hypothetical protein